MTKRKKIFSSVIKKIVIAIGFIIIVCLLFFLYMDISFRQVKKKGYSYLPPIRPEPPYYRSYDFLGDIAIHYERNLKKYWPWPEIPKITDQFKNITILMAQPYKEQGILIFKNLKINQKFIYNPVRSIRIAKNNIKCWEVRIVVYTQRYKQNKGYLAYNTYPKIFQKPLDPKDFKTWAVLLDDHDGMSYVDILYSEIPIIPGCIVDLDKEKVYYPEDIIPAFKEIYPKADIPEKLIIEDVNEIPKQKKS